MAEAQVKKVLEKEITCPLCMDIFKEPKKLPCDHVYCKACLTTLAGRSASSIISCPECRTHTEVPKNDANNLKTAFHINRLVEAFQQIHVKTDKGIPMVEQKCSIHLNEPLAIYCETCKKQLCRDCLLRSKEHTGHEYGFFDDVIPIYRKKISTKLASVKNCDSNITEALTKIAENQSLITSEERKCQGDIDNAFEMMHLVLQYQKQAMKNEVSDYYSSLTNTYEQQTKELQETQSRLRREVSVATDKTLGDDQKFISIMESAITHLEEVLKRCQNVPLNVTKPQLIAAQFIGNDSLLQYMKENCCLHKVADPEMCRMEESMEGSMMKLWTNHQNKLTIALHDTKGNTCHGKHHRVEAYLVGFQGNKVRGQITVASTSDRVEITLNPQQRGRHILNVKVNGDHIHNSPFTARVNIQPRALSKPVATIVGLKQPSCLVSSQDKILAAERGQNRIIEIDSRQRVSEFKSLQGPSRLTQDRDLNIYVTSSTEHKLYKLSKSGEKLKVIGELGSSSKVRVA